VTVLRFFGLPPTFSAPELGAVNILCCPWDALVTSFVAFFSRGLFSSSVPFAKEEPLQTQFTFPLLLLVDFRSRADSFTGLRGLLPSFVAEKDPSTSMLSHLSRDSGIVVSLRACFLWGSTFLVLRPGRVFFLRGPPADSASIQESYTPGQSCSAFSLVLPPLSKERSLLLRDA